jgi:hypothetical protein
MAGAVAMAWVCAGSASAAGEINRNAEAMRVFKIRSLWH